MCSEWGSVFTARSHSVGLGSTDAAVLETRALAGHLAGSDQHPAGQVRAVPGRALGDQEPTRVGVDGVRPYGPGQLAHDGEEPTPMKADHAFLRVRAPIRGQRGRE